MQFGVVHLGSRNMEFEGCPTARCASSLASAEIISLAVAAASAGHRKGVRGTKAHRQCDRHRQTVGLPKRIVNAASSIVPPLQTRPFAIARRAGAGAPRLSKRRAGSAPSTHGREFHLELFMNGTAGSEPGLSECPLSIALVCCARTANGHATAPLAKRLTKYRRLTGPRSMCSLHVAGRRHHNRTTKAGASPWDRPELF